MKLEKRNKEIGSRALAPRESWALAVEQGYRPMVDPEHVSGVEIEGIEGRIDVLVIAR